MEGFELTEEKVRKLMPLFEGIWSRKYGKKITLKNLTVGNVTVYKNGCAK